MNILWRRLDRPGHEAARLVGQSLIGAAVFAHEGSAVSLTYAVKCNPSWETEMARVSGWIGDSIVDLTVTVDASRRWRLNGVEVPAVEGCIDVDLNFSPSTNTLPIRRLQLDVGQQAVVRAAWLRFPSLALEVLEQTYRRLDRSRYRYESGSFAADLDVNGQGLATAYANVWVAESY